MLKILFSRLEMIGDYFFNYVSSRGTERILVPMLAASLLLGLVTFVLAALVNTSLTSSAKADGWNDIAAWVSIVLGVPVALGGSIVAIILAQRSVDISESTRKLEDLQARKELLEPITARAISITTPLTQLKDAAVDLEQKAFVLLVSYAQSLDDFYETHIHESHLKYIKDIVKTDSFRSFSRAENDFRSAKDRFLQSVYQATSCPLVNQKWQALSDKHALKIARTLIDRGDIPDKRGVSLSTTCALLMSQKTIGDPTIFALLLLDREYAETIQKYCKPLVDPYSGSTEPSSFIQWRSARREIMQSANITVIRSITGSLLWSNVPPQIEKKPLIDYTEEEWNEYEKERDAREAEYLQKLYNGSQHNEYLEDLDFGQSDYEEYPDWHRAEDDLAKFFPPDIQNLGRPFLDDVHSIFFERDRIRNDLVIWARPLMENNVPSPSIPRRAIETHSHNDVLVTAASLAVSSVPQEIFKEEASDQLSLQGANIK